MPEVEREAWPVSAVPLDVAYDQVRHQHWMDMMYVIPLLRDFDRRLSELEQRA